MVINRRLCLWAGTQQCSLPGRYFLSTYNYWLNIIYLINDITYCFFNYRVLEPLSFELPGNKMDDSCLINGLWDLKYYNFANLLKEEDVTSRK